MLHSLPSVEMLAGFQLPPPPPPPNIHASYKQPYMLYHSFLIFVLFCFFEFFFLLPILSDNYLNLLNSVYLVSFYTSSHCVIQDFFTKSVHIILSCHWLISQSGTE